MMLDIAEMAQRWQLADVRALAETPGSLVFRARHPDGRSVVVKLLKPRGIGEITGMDYLAWRDGRGAARLLAREANACLLEDAGSRTLESLRQSDGEAVATEKFAAILKQLHGRSPHSIPDSLVPLERHFAALVSRTRDAPPEHATDIAWAAAVARDLLATQSDVIPLHGDLHHENVLADDTGRWRAIDPHGLIGDPVYDAANFFGNPLGRPDITCDQARIRLLAQRLAPALNCSEGKLLRYAAAHAALSACWSIDNPVSEDDRGDALTRLRFLHIARSALDATSR